MNAIMPDKSLCKWRRPLALRVFKHYRELGPVRTVGVAGCNNVHLSSKNVRTDVYNSCEILALLLLYQFEVVGCLCNASFQHTQMQLVRLPVLCLCCYCYTAIVLQWPWLVSTRARHNCCNTVRSGNIRKCYESCYRSTTTVSFRRFETPRILGSALPPPKVMNGRNSVALAQITITGGYRKSGFGKGGVGNN